MTQETFEFVKNTPDPNMVKLVEFSNKTGSRNLYQAAVKVLVYEEGFSTEFINYCTGFLKDQYGSMVKFN